MFWTHVLYSSRGNGMWFVPSYRIIQELLDPAIEVTTFTVALGIMYVPEC
jgi:hypothetical protein